MQDAVFVQRGDDFVGYFQRPHPRVFARQRRFIEHETRRAGLAGEIQRLLGVLEQNMRRPAVAWRHRAADAQ